MALSPNDLKEKIRRGEKIRFSDVNDTTEIGAAIEALNKEVEERNQKDGEYAISSISRFLERISTSKTFVPTSKKL